MAVLFWAYAASLSEIILVGHRALYVVGSDRKYHPFPPYAYFLGISPPHLLQNRFIYGNIAILKRISVSEKREKCT